MRRRHNTHLWSASGAAGKREKQVRVRLDLVKVERSHLVPSQFSARSAPRQRPQSHSQSRNPDPTLTNAQDNDVRDALELRDRGFADRVDVLPLNADLVGGFKRHILQVCVREDELCLLQRKRRGLQFSSNAPSPTLRATSKDTRASRDARSLLSPAAPAQQFGTWGEQASTLLRGPSALSSLEQRHIHGC